MSDNQTEIQLFSKKRLVIFSIYFVGAIAFVVLLGWVAGHVSGVKVDWSFLIPLAGAVGTVIPIATAIASYLNKELKEQDKRIDALEALSEADKLRAEHAERDRYELRKVLLKLEARIESLRDNQVGVQLGELVEQNRQLLKKLGLDLDE